MPTSQDGLNTWVMKRPWAGALLGVVFIVMAIGLWVSEDGTGRYRTDSIWVDYIVAPLALLLGIAGLIAAAVRTARGSGRATTS
jgi:nitrate reductase gamma subunit